MQSAVLERRENVHRQKHVAFQVQLEPRRERELPDSFGERHERFERRGSADCHGRRLSLVAHLPSTEDVAPEQIHQQRQLWRGLVLEARRVLNLVPAFDRRTPWVEADDEINAVTPRFEPAVRVRTKPSLSAGVDQGNAASA